MIMFIVLAITALYFLYKYLTPSFPPNFPPGPKCYPFAGTVPTILSLDKFIPKALIKIGETYGPVAGCYFGKRRAIIINGHEMIREVLMSDKFNGRPPLLNGFRPDKLGILFVDGEFWRVQRRFTLRHLRDWGFGKVSLEGVIHEEIQECVTKINAKIESSNDGVIPVHDLFNISMVNILWAITAGKRYDHDDPLLRDILTKLNAVFRSGSPLGSIVSDYPVTRYLPYLRQFWRTQVETQESIMSLLRETIVSHKKSRDPANPRDFIDEYLHELEDNPDGKPTEPTFSMPQLTNICMDLFAAGAESTANSIAFTILYSILHPEVQKRTRAEVLAVAGKERLLSYTEKAKLPFVEAVIAEVQRVSNIAPTTVPHCTVEDTKLGGYDIPKNTMVTVNLYSMHMSKELWGDPENFRPERFLDSDGKFQKPDHVTPFGIGKRSCPGEPLARMNLFLFYATMLQHFDFQVADEEGDPTTDPLPGFTIAPKPFKAKVTPI